MRLAPLPSALAGPVAGSGRFELAVGARDRPGGVAAGAAGPAAPCPAATLARGRGAVAGSGAGWRPEGREGGEGGPRAAPVTWRVAGLEQREAAKRIRGRVGLEQRPPVWAPPLLWSRGGSSPSAHLDRVGEARCPSGSWGTRISVQRQCGMLAWAALLP